MRVRRSSRPLAGNLRGRARELRVVTDSSGALGCSGVGSADGVARDTIGSCRTSDFKKASIDQPVMGVCSTWRCVPPNLVPRTRRGIYPQRRHGVGAAFVTLTADHDCSWFLVLRRDASRCHSARTWLRWGERGLLHNARSPDAGLETPVDDLGAHKTHDPYAPQCSARQD